MSSLDEMLNEFPEEDQNDPNDGNEGDGDNMDRDGGRTSGRGIIVSTDDTANPKRRGENSVASIDDPDDTSTA